MLCMGFKSTVCLVYQLFLVLIVLENSGLLGARLTLHADMITNSWTVVSLKLLREKL